MSIIPSKSLIIILHEIYGINKHILNTAEYWRNNGFDVIIPDLYESKKSFDYIEESYAYEYFAKNVGFDTCTKKVNELIKESKKIYEHIFLIGYSIGATVSWICSKNPECSGVVCYYGSRIRDYMDITPAYPTLLIFGSIENSFDVQELADKIKEIDSTEVYILNGNHGFADLFSKHYFSDSEKSANELVKLFLNRRIENG